MERLTEKELEDGWVVYNKTEYAHDTTRFNSSPIRKIIERLKEYKDLEEQGKLLKLPCSVGDMVYAFRFREIFALRVDSFEVCSDVIYLRLINDTPGYKFMRMTLDIASFGKEWFLNREAAEAVLKEMSE